MTRGAIRRFPIRYAIQRWNDGIWFYGSFFIILVVLVAVNLRQGHQIASFIPVLVLDLAILVTFWLMRSFSYVEIADDSLRVRYLFRHVELPYTALSRVRRQPLEVAFQPAERRRFVNRFVRRLAKEPAAYIRLDRRQRDLVEHTERQLGPRLVAGADVVVPIVDLDDFVITHRTQLVLKPNDEYGGKGVVLGWTIDQHEWEQSFLAALASSYVVQERVSVPRYPFPVVLDRMHFLDLSIDHDPYLFWGRVSGTLARVSSSALLNVTAGAGSVVPTYVVAGGRRVAPIPNAARNGS